MASQSFKATLLSVIHLLAATAIYWHLITGGWLTNAYHLDDPNIINLVLALFEPVAVAAVLAYWVWRKRFLYRIIFILGGVQILLGVGVVLFFLLFALSYHPKLM